MLILLPASERKAPVDQGHAFDPADLSFPSLAPTRETVLDALATVSARPDAARRLNVPVGVSDLVRENVVLRGAPTADVGCVYAGPLYEGLGWASLDGPSRRSARSWIVVVSALWGAVRLGDRIPRYRLNMCGRLPGLGHLPQVWRDPLDTVLPAQAGRGVVVDCRSAEYATAWRPLGELAERTLVVKVRAGSHRAKSLRGQLARRIVMDAIDGPEPEDVVGALSEHFAVDLRPPERPGRTWALAINDVIEASA